VILLVLLQSNLSGIRVGEIAEKTHLTRPSVSHHLKILKEAGIVAMRSEGTKNYYYLSADETKWKDISELETTVYNAIQHMDKEN
jgi:DNA-binding transcriptional ArsR family regulator